VPPRVGAATTDGGSTRPKRLEALFDEAPDPDGQQRAALVEGTTHVAAALDNPNITTMHEIGEADGRDGVAFESVDARPLAGRPVGPAR
jgi:hypothetical protein